MKRFLALAITVSSVTAYAASDRAIYDIMYLPNSGTSYGFTELALLKRDADGISGRRDVSSKAWGVNQTIGHSLTDKFTVNLDMNYVSAKIKTDGSKSFDQKGISDPTINGRFRLIDETLKFDLIGGIMLGLGDAKIKSNNDMNHLQGGNAINAGAQLGQKFASMQWAFSTVLRRNFDRDYDFGPADITFKSNNELKLRADLLNKLAELSFLRSHLQASFEEGIKTSDANYTGKYLFAPTATYEIGTEYQHLISSNLLGRAGIDYTVNKARTHQYKSDHAWTLNLAANYQF